MMAANDADTHGPRLRITEIFRSLQGEGLSTGCPTVFVRLTGCPLRCRYCDTAYAFQGGRSMTLDAVLDAVALHATRRVTVTGGEPLAQKACPELLGRLCDAGHEVSLETSGALDIGPVDPRVIKVMDLKAPGSGEAEKNLYANILQLTPRDQVKFVLCDRVDYDWAREKVFAYSLSERCEVLFSPCAGKLDATALANWILADKLAVRLQIQLHKLLWGDEPGR